MKNCVCRTKCNDKIRRENKCVLWERDCDSGKNCNICDCLTGYAMKGCTIFGGFDSLVTYFKEKDSW